MVPFSSFLHWWLATNKEKKKNILNIIHNYKIKIKLNSGSGDTDYNIIEVVGFFVD